MQKNHTPDKAKAIATTELFREERFMIHHNHTYHRLYCFNSVYKNGRG